MSIITRRARLKQAIKKDQPSEAGPFFAPRFARGALSGGPRSCGGG